MNHAPDAPVAPQIDFDTFLEIDISRGYIIEAREFPEARKPAYILTIDFGPRSAARKAPRS